MSRPLLSSTAARRFSQAPQTRLFSTSRPAQRLSAFPDGELAACRQYIHIQQSAPRCLSRPSTPRYSFLRPQHAYFSSSTVRPGTKVTQNPRAGDDGATLMIKISPRAVERLREITDPTTSPSATREENPYHHLRITVTSGGCHGFQYLMSLESAAKIDPEEDTIFEGEEDVATTNAAGGGARVVMDEPSLELLHGSTVDYTTELIGSQFKIVDNPRATSNCGCGTSFDVTD
ncbi:FeS cluster insertion protein [Penicillium riverlandense]|uniref:FeS cluster insertion protein n=1 Tax=Penicillium riverlandense TaxID=1903569 RepID=UPI002547F598|nr:FeS cluster insertion protein [Penicillium riverlandense]KAJ5805014.1 FeS cluster insertion protein [Penicillium riverlandense]